MAASGTAPAQILNISHLRDSLRLLSSDHQWQISEALRDGDPLPRFTTGGQITNLTLAENVPQFNFANIIPSTLSLRPPPAGELPVGPIEPHPPAPAPAPAPLPARPKAVDWRNRWNGNWLCTVQNQGRCGNCWAFGAAALVETMVRIEFNIWSKRSEGDIRDGWFHAGGNLGPSPCAHGASEPDCLNYVKSNGVADPECFAYVDQDTSYTPSPDRNGRTTRNLDYVNLGSLEDQKKWIDQNGPIVTFLTAFDDIFGYGSGVYRKSPKAKVAGGHIVLIVGYDDNRQCWTFRNSWGPNWGMHGYCDIAYGECDIDRFSKQGVKGVNPDPWVKRRLHNGCMIQSGNGARHQNYELMRNGFPYFRHVFRDGNSLAWGATPPVATATPQQLNNWDFSRNCVGMPSLIASTYNRNFEIVYREVGGHMRNWYKDQATGQWHDVGSFGDGTAAGYPGYIQSTFGLPGNFEVVIMGKDGRLQHWWRHDVPWSSAGSFASNVRMSGPALVQANVGKIGHFYVVAVMQTGEMQMWWKDNDAMVWYPGETFGSGIGETPPVMIQASYGTKNELDAGNFEVFVAVGGKVQHWWRDNHDLKTVIPPQGKVTDQSMVRWNSGGAFGHDIKHVWSTLQGVGKDYMEVIVERTDSRLQQYYRGDGRWYEGAIIDI